jgi:hypothetical protein
VGFEDRSDGSLTVGSDNLRDVCIRQAIPDDFAVGVSTEWRPIEDRINQATQALVGLSPVLWHDVVIIEVPILWDVPSHPVARPAQHKQIEDAIIDGCAALNLLAEIKRPEARLELSEQCRFGRIIVEPSLQVEEIA